MRIGDLLGGRTVVTTEPDATVRDLVALLREHDIGAVVVCDPAEEGAVAGIVSERDVVRRLGTEPDLLDAPVSSIMSTELHTCEPSATVDDLMRLMTQRRVRHVPVLEADAAGGSASLVGIISIGDVVKQRIGELQFERDQLDHYLHQG